MTARNLRRLGVLTSDLQLPVMSQTSVRSNLLESLQIISQLLVDGIGKCVGVFAVYHVFLPVQEPVGDFELSGVLHDRDDTFEFIGIEFASTASGSSVSKSIQDSGV